MVQVGNLEGVRDFTDVRDTVRAYWLALEKGRPGEIYNVCSGKGRRVRDLLDGLLARSRAKIKVRKEAGRLRKINVPRLVGNPSKFKRDTGWMPEISFEKTLDDLLDDWRARVDIEISRKGL